MFPLHLADPIYEADLSACPGPLSDPPDLGSHPLVPPSPKVTTLSHLSRKTAGRPALITLSHHEGLDLCPHSFGRVGRSGACRD